MQVNSWTAVTQRGDTVPTYLNRPLVHSESRAQLHDARVYCVPKATEPWVGVRRPGFLSHLHLGSTLRLGQVTFLLDLSFPICERGGDWSRVVSGFSQLAPAVLGSVRPALSGLGGLWGNCWWPSPLTSPRRILFLSPLPFLWCFLSPHPPRLRIHRNTCSALPGCSGPTSHTELFAIFLGRPQPGGENSTHRGL